MDKDVKEGLCESFFKGQIKPKHLSNFEETTPDGNIISGVICKKPNKYLGSMVITHIKTQTNEFDTLQFIQSMPKIHYYSYKNELAQDDNFTEYLCYEKLDGTCLIIYPLFDNVGQLLEIIPKTRGTAVADKRVLGMFKLIDTINIELFFEEFPNAILLFELYGTFNKHEISYPKYYIDTRLLGVVLDGEFLLDSETEFMSKMYGFERPEVLYSIIFHKGIWKVISNPINSIAYYDNTDSTIEYATQIDMITALKDALTELNKQYNERNGIIKTEGVVINGVANDGSLLFMKVKPWDIEEKCRTEHGIPRKFISKEIHKYFDEYGSRAKELYKKNPSHSLNYVLNNLSEEFSDDAVADPKTIRKVQKMFLDMLDAKEPPMKLKQICEELSNQYPDYGVTDLMRIFAQEYPEKKRHASTVYSIFDGMLG